MAKNIYKVIFLIIVIALLSMSLSMSMSMNAFSMTATKEYTGSFIVTIYDQYIQVVSPSSTSAGVSASTPALAENAALSISVIADNKTLSKLLAKIETEDKKTIAYLNVPAQSAKKTDLKIANKNTKIIFTPLAPAFQEVKLIFGSIPYEIPARNTNTKSNSEPK
ncbi:MAG: hypothetical protein HQK49_04280 [Oligoflexia bacterium]|nr:hypothetical protein [Oligoflexia bacterium]